MPRGILVSLSALTILVSGCAGMPLSSMFKLRQIDFLELDPTQLRVAIRADERIVIPEDGVKLSLRFDAEDGSLNIDDDYVVEVVRDPILTPELVAEKARRESVTVLQLSESDAQKMTRVWSRIKLYTDGRRSGSLSIGVDVKSVCVISPIPADKVLIDIFIQASDNDGFFVINNNLDLRQHVGDSGSVPESFSQCPGHPNHGQP